jgi:CRP-like cAMP-binding protein
MMTAPQLVSPTDRLLYLRALGVEMPLSEVRLLAEHAVERSFKPGAVIFGDGEPVGSVWSLTQGRVELRYAGGMEALEAPALIGLLQALGGMQGTQAVATELVVTLELDADLVLSIVRSNFILLEAIMGRMAKLALRLNPLPTRGTPISADLSPVRPLDLVDRLEALRSIGFLRRVNLATLVPLAESMRLVDFSAGQDLWAVGAPAEHGIIIASGTAGCRMNAGADVVVGSGSGLGFFHTLARQPRSYTATALTPVVGFRIDMHELLALAEYRRSLGMDILAGLARLVGERTGLGQSE